MSYNVGNAAKKTIRSAPNPMDKCTIVSIFPRKIDEFKATIQPGRFIIAPGTLAKPSILVVGQSSWWRELDEQQPPLEIVVSSIQVADSVIKDYSNGILGCDMNTRRPGLFYVMGEHNVASILKDHKDKLDKADKLQRNWYAELVRMADILWSRSNSNPLSISDHMKLAAEALQLQENKAWMKDTTTLELKNCPACGVLRNNDFPVCHNCKSVIDKKKFDSLGLQFASV